MNQLVAYLVAIIGITCIAVVGVVSLEVLRPEGINTNATYTILGICTPTLAVLVGVIKSIGNGQIVARIEKSVEDARQQGS